jgi:phosphotransferase system enzyme I (PtsI)
VLAIITETGGATSHSAIIARSYEIPAILGVGGLLAALKDGMTAAVDAHGGEVFLEPDGETCARVDAAREAWLREREISKTFLKKEGRTACGERVEIGLNIGSAGDEELRGAEYTDYAGLFRTEFLYLGRERLPSEDEQFEVYRKVLSLYGSRPLTLRTLDIGGDKQLSSLKLPPEENPFLGKRALRLCFAYPELFKTQLRAALRASVYGNLYLMLPMVGSLDDIRQAKLTLEEVKAELDAEGKAYRKDYKLGIMIEIPSIALIADLAAQEVDFASVGTNDLCQYLCAVDRMNPEIASYYQSYHPALFRIIGAAARCFAAAGKPLSVCGEMGGDPPAALALAGLGIRKLSMGLAQIAAVKRMLAGLRLADAQEAAHAVQQFSTAAEAESFLREKEELCTKKR